MFASLRRFEGSIVNLLNACFSLSHRVDHLLENSLFFCDLLFPHIALTDQSIVLRLILHVAGLNFIEYFGITFLKHIHIVYKIVLVRV